MFKTIGFLFITVFLLTLTLGFVALAGAMFALGLPPLGKIVGFGLCCWMAWVSFSATEDYLQKAGA